MKKIGRYEIVEELGRGAMGVVYKASDPTIGRLVAIKVLSLDAPGEAGIPGAREIFMREARAAGRLSHPGIVTIHDALEDPESRRSYIVMEFVPGRTLEGILTEKPALSPEHALDIIRQVAEALDYAHRQKIIHRDLKPANILLTEDDRVKITDFGIAKIVAREGAMRTVAIMGTPAYMSPEQVKGGEIDARSDLFSMGILLFLMLTGQKPFTGDTAAVMFKVVYEDPVLPSQLNSKLGAGHDYLVMRCLAKDRDKRYPTVREFLDDLRDVCEGRPPRSKARVPAEELRAGEPTLVARKPLLGVPEERPPSRRRPGAGWAGIAAAVLLVALAGWSIWRLRRAVTAPTAPAAVSATSAETPTPVSSAPEALGGATATPSPEAAAKVAEPTPASARGARPTRAGKVVTLECRHQLEEATLLVLSGNETILQARLQGRKRGGFAGIGAGYRGVLTQPITIPAGSRELTVRVYSADGSVNVLNRITARPPPGGTDTLHVVPTRDKLSLMWERPGTTTP